MAIDPLLSWREPLLPTWRDEAEILAGELKLGGRVEKAAQRLRRLAGMRLGDGERLRLGRLVKSARALPEALPGFRRFRLLIVSNRTASFLAQAVESAGAARGLMIEAVEAPYDSVRALALSDAVEPPPGPFDAALLLVDWSFFPNPCGLLDLVAEAAAQDGMGEELKKLTATLRVKAGAPVIAATIPLPPEQQVSSADVTVAGTANRFVQHINRTLAECAAAREVILFDLAAVAARIGSNSFFDPVRYLQAKVPFSLEATPVVADALAALIAAMTGLAGRALVLDLDNTIWGGVVADDGPEGLVLGQGSATGEAFLAIQLYALELRRRGVVLAVCSKNLPEIAREPFRSHPEMLLREQHITVFDASFDDKATAIARIADELDLDPASLVFLDDNPAERERVRSALPRVMVPEVGTDPAYYPIALAASGFFEHLPLTAEDAGRAAAYRARSDARALQALAEDYPSYLRSLEMTLAVQPFDAVGRARIAQLIQKSNQFNLTTRRYSELEVAAIEADTARLGWQVRLKDRFADHGMISVMVIDMDEAAWSIDSWVMSCRVLERGVEAALIAEVARAALAAGARELVATYRPTARNGLVRELYPRLGFMCAGIGEDGAQIYRLELAAATFNPPPMSVQTPTLAP